MARSLGVLLLLMFGACGSSRPTSSGERSAPVTIAEATSVSSAAFHCYSWIHGPAFSTPCFRARPACDAAAQSMTDSGRDVIPCEAQASAWCALVGEERCFQTGGDCARYIEAFAVDGEPLPSCQTSK